VELEKRKTVIRNFFLNQLKIIITKQKKYKHLQILVEAYTTKLQTPVQDSPNGV
jgi:hypothetical protein